MNRIPAFLVLLATVGCLQARPIQHWPYGKLNKEADLIVIATPVRVVDTGKATVLPGVQRGTSDGEPRPIPAIEMRTTFQVLAMLKGDSELAEFTLTHLRETDPPEIQINGPGLVAFEPEEKRRYLLFLKAEPDGGYVPLTGQTDPAMAVRDLGTYP